MQKRYLDDVIFHIIMLHLIIWSVCYDDKNTVGISWWCHYILPDYLIIINNFKLRFKNLAKSVRGHSIPDLSDLCASLLLPITGNLSVTLMELWHALEQCVMHVGWWSMGQTHGLIHGHMYMYLETLPLQVEPQIIFGSPLQGCSYLYV